MSRSVAVIDVGSNSIKLLVADAYEGQLRVLDEKTYETRISEGIDRTDPVLTEAAMNAGADSIEQLVLRARAHQPREIVITATSAVRDARNRDRFIARVENATGIRLRTLSGLEEAQYIGRGVANDPALEQADNFVLLDLGGGSLELIEFEHHEIAQKTSLQLGAVRMMEHFVPDPRVPMDVETRQNIRAHVCQAIQASGFRFLEDSGGLVGTGGAVTYARFLLGAQSALRPAESSPHLPVEGLRSLADRLCSMRLDERQQLELLPASRADIMPNALVTLVTVAETAGADTIIHSFYNLRYGLAAELLESELS